MKKKVKKLWQDALRSGKYEQTKSYLHIDNTYCCLGVLVEIYRTTTGKGTWTQTSEEGPAGTMKFCPGPKSKTEARRLPIVVQKWAGLRNNWDGANPYLGQATCSGQNDIYNKDFNQIADLIEKHL